jgi:hypothetical protein
MNKKEVSIFLNQVPARTASVGSLEIITKTCSKAINRTESRDSGIYY